MTWVQRTDPRTTHHCPVPRGSFGSPAGQWDDLWRCNECRTLWRIGDACDICDRRGDQIPHRGGHTTGLEWRLATWWQRLRYRRSGCA